MICLMQHFEIILGLIFIYDSFEISTGLLIIDHFLSFFFILKSSGVLLFIQLGGFNFFSLRLVDVLNQHSFVFELITLTGQVKLMVPESKTLLMLVDFLSLSVLSQESS